MIEYLYLSVLIAVLGIALVITVASVALPRARARRLAESKSHEIGSEQDLQDLLRKVDQATTEDDLNHLENEKEEN